MNSIAKTRHTIELGDHRGPVVRPNEAALDIGEGQHGKVVTKLLQAGIGALSLSCHWLLLLLTAIAVTVTRRCSDTTPTARYRISVVSIPARLLQ